MKRKIIDHYRREARSPFVPLDLSPDQAPEAEFFWPTDGHWRAAQHPADWPGPGPDEGRGDLALEQQEFQHVLRLGQQRLSAQQLAVFVLRFVEELPAEGICKELNITLANYWVLVHRAKLYLRRCLEKNWLHAPAVA